MNPAKETQYEPSRDAKRLNRPTRKAARTRGGFRHPGVVQTANASRDVALAALGMGLEFGSLAALMSQVPFHPGIIAGLVAFDLSGALMKHCGLGDKHWREAKIAVAANTEEQAAIRSQTPTHHGLVRALGGVFIALPCAFKMATLVTTGALAILGGLGPALMVSYAAVAIIHWTVTGYALAHVRKEWAEARERRAMLRSSENEEERQRHAQHVKANRVYQFESTVRLVPVGNVDGHSLRMIDSGMIDSGVSLFTYQFVTWGSFDDSDLDAMVARQTRPEQMSTLYRHGLIHQLEIEDSEVLAAEAGPEEVHAAATNEAEVSFQREASPGMLRQFGKTALLLALTLSTLSLGACRKAAEPVVMNLHIVAAHRVAANPESALPADIVTLAAPAKPYAECFVPITTAVRVDQKETTQARLGEGKKNFLQKAVDGTMKFNSAALMAHQVGENIRDSKADVFGLPAETDEAATRKSLREWVKHATARGTKVLALKRIGGHPTLDLGEGIIVPAFENPQALTAHWEVSLKSSPHGEFAVLLDPPGDPVIADAPTVADNAVAANTQEEVGGVSIPGAGGGSTVNVIIERDKRQNGQAFPPFNTSIKQMGKAITFDSGSAKLTGEAISEVHKIVTEIKTGYATRPIVLVSSADHLGKEEKNKALSKERATAVESVLIAAGLKVVRTMANGENLAPEDTPPVRLSLFREVRVYVERKGE